MKPRIRGCEQRRHVPASVAESNDQVTVKFQATGGNETGGVFGIRMIIAN